MLKQRTTAVLFFLLSLPVFAEQNTNRIHINVPIASVYQYITQPDKWHDWFPHSKSAKTPGGSLVKGQAFSELVTVNKQDSLFDYTVIEAQAPSVWRVEFTSKSIIGSIQYQLQETIDGTLLTRSLEYFPVPKNKEEQLILAKLAMQVQPTSIKALLQLRKNLEAAWEASSNL